MSWRCCKCKGKFEINETKKQCINCNHNEYYWINDNKENLKFNRRFSIE